MRVGALAAGFGSPSESFRGDMRFPRYFTRFVAGGTRFTPGGFQVPSMIDGGVSWGQYSRIISTNFSFGAGSQLASLSLPGDSFWINRSSEPSALYFKSLRGLTVYLSSGFATKKYSALY